MLIFGPQGRVLMVREEDGVLRFLGAAFPGPDGSRAGEGPRLDQPMVTAGRPDPSLEDARRIKDISVDSLRRLLPTLSPLATGR
jgi:hypothetical protein